MILNLTDEHAVVLKRALNSIIDQSEMMSSTIFLSRAARLRKEADKIEQSEKDFPLIIEIAQKLSKYE